MDNTQAAAVLREASDSIPKFKNIEVPMTDVAQACARGADALEMLEWLFAPGRFGLLHSGFMKPSAEETTFLAFCEARFEESKKGLTK